MFSLDNLTMSASRTGQMNSPVDLEQFLGHATTYHHHFEEDSEGEDEGVTTLPMGLPAPLLLVADEDGHTGSTHEGPLPLPTGCFEQRPDTSSVTGSVTAALIADTAKAFTSQSENNISDSPLAVQLRGASSPPPYTPADSTRVGAEVDCCTAIEKAKVKTVMCLNYMHGRRCRFGAHCAFAHGAQELRQAPPEMMAKKQAIVSSSKPLLSDTPPPSYTEALAAPEVETPALGDVPAYAEAVREHGHLVLSSSLMDARLPVVAVPVLAKVAFAREPLREKCGGEVCRHSTSALSVRQRGQGGSGGNARLINAQPRRVKHSPV